MSELTREYPTDGTGCASTRTLEDAVWGLNSSHFDPLASYDHWLFDYWSSLVQLHLWDKKFRTNGPPHKLCEIRGDGCSSVIWVIFVKCRTARDSPPSCLILNVSWSRMSSLSTKSSWWPSSWLHCGHRTQHSTPQKPVWPRESTLFAWTCFLEVWNCSEVVMTSSLRVVFASVLQ